MADGVVWKSQRERNVAVALGLRVVALNGATPCQVQQLEPLKRGGIGVRSVAPGDTRHLALWELLMQPESEWGTAEALIPEGEKENGQSGDT